MSVAEISALHARYVRLSDRFKSVWTYHQFASGVFKNFLSASLPYAIDFQKIFEDVKKVSGSLTTTLAGEANTTLTAADSALDKAAATILTADQRIPPSMLRRFFEKLKNTDENIIHHLIKFYFYADATEGDCRDKLDYLFTRIGEDFIEERGEYWTRDSLIFREKIVALTAVRHQATAPQEEVVRLIRSVRAMRDDIQSVEQFEDLTERSLLRNSRMFKHKIGDLFFHPDVLLAIVELNVQTKNRFLKLYKAEESRLLSDAARLMDHGTDLEKHLGDTNPKLVEEIARFRQYKERFDELRAQSNVKHDVITHLKTSMAKILSQIDSVIEGDEETTAGLAEALPEPSAEAERLNEQFGEEPVLLPYLLRIATAITAFPEDMPAADMVEQESLADLRLESFEAAAYRKLFTGAIPEIDGEDENLWKLFLRSAAIRNRIDEQAMTIASATNAGVRPDRELMDASRTTLDSAKLVDDSFTEVIRDPRYTANGALLHQIYRSRFRLLRCFSGLWLVYDHMSSE